MLKIFGKSDQTIFFIVHCFNLDNLYIRLQLIKPPESEEELIGYVMEGLVQFVIVCVDASEYVNYKKGLDIAGIELFPTRVIDFTDEAYIAHRKYHGAKQIFEYFKHFSFGIISMIFLSLFTLSILLSWHKLTFSNFSNQLFETTTALFSRNLPRPCNKSYWRSFTLIVIGSWLISCMFISFLFSGLILDEKVKTNPEIKIDSWDDLYHRSRLKFISIEKTLIAEFINTDSSMAIDFRKRMIKTTFNEWENPENWRTWAQKMYSGEIAFVVNKYRLVFRLIQMSRLLNFKNSEHFIENLHISREGGSALPFFMISTIDINHTYYKHLDHLYYIISLSIFYD